MFKGDQILKGLSICMVILCSVAVVLACTVEMIHAPEAGSTLPGSVPVAIVRPVNPMIENAPMSVEEKALYTSAVDMAA